MRLSAVMKPLVLHNPIMHLEPQTTTIKFESRVTDQKSPVEMHPSSLGSGLGLVAYIYSPS